MGEPAVVMGDQITGSCAGHVVPAPSGNPTPAPALPFAAPLQMNLAMSVVIGGKAAAVVGASRRQHAAAPRVCIRTIRTCFRPRRPALWIAGSATVLFESEAGGEDRIVVHDVVLVPGSLSGTAATVLVGG